MRPRHHRGIDVGQLRAHGTVALPELPTVPVDPFRTSLYSPVELYDTVAAGGGYAASLDARAYAWTQQPREPEAMLAQVLHDHAIDEALAGWVRAVGRRPLVGVMGGHALERGESSYVDAARLGRSLAGTAVVATGGGPGAMEAANLGALLSAREPAALDEALALLSRTPSFRADLDAWAASALAVVAATSDGVASLGIPTWHYGHEPPNAFATTIAKYFRNATREAILLEVCDGGIVFLPGAGGTVQEVFQDACENYYAEPERVAPMILVGRAYWTESLPAWPLLQRLARGRAMEPHIHLVDSAEEAAALLAS
jgi:predicted Rossmann-fold nucleotide-binding protein